jgi:hypothetical protein
MERELARPEAGKVKRRCRDDKGQRSERDRDLGEAHRRDQERLSRVIDAVMRSVCRRRRRARCGHRFQGLSPTGEVRVFGATSLSRDERAPPPMREDRK